MAIDRATKSAAVQSTAQFSTFIVADLFFGVDVLDVQEVLRAQQMTAVPQAPDAIEGLINLRGQIVTAIDMRRRLQLPPQDGDQPSMNMVIRTADGAVSLLVDEIGDVLDMDAATYERPPQNLDPTAREMIRGVYKLKDGLLLVLDTEKAIETCNGNSSLNSQIDVQSQQKNSSVPVDSADSRQLQGSAKKGSKKKAVKNTNGTERGSLTGSG